MKLRLRKADKRFLASFFANMSAGWTGAILIVPNFVDIYSTKGFATLTLDIVYAILFAVLSIRMERKL